MAKVKTKEQRIIIEDKRLRAIYKDLPKDTLALFDGIIKRAAYMRVTLEDYEADLDADGYTEMFTQSANTPPYERERPVARLYNSMNKNYQSIMKQLNDALPEQSVVDPGADILKFISGGKK